MAKESRAARHPGGAVWPRRRRATPVTEHRHAFWLPEDADGAGPIDLLTVYAQAMDGTALAAPLAADMAIHSRSEHGAPSPTGSAGMTRPIRHLPAGAASTGAAWLR